MPEGSTATKQAFPSATRAATRTWSDVLGAVWGIAGMGAWPAVLAPGRLRLRISATWPWRDELTTAFYRLTTLPRPAG
jgi:hypothetical protein